MDAARTDETGLRSDAARNRARIVETARELFRTRGIDVPMNTIARHAGVGVATLFRRFPTRDALVIEVFAEQIARCQVVLDDAVDDPDPWHGFCRLIEFTCAEQLKDRGLTEAFLALFAGEIDYEKRRRDVETAFKKLVHRAQEAGRLRPDFDYGDLVMVLLANGGLRNAPPEHAEDLSRRFVVYLLQTFSTEGGAEREPLPPASPLGLHHVQRQGEDA
ncbi:TetR/AcrR family transcriptional regulator [Amycolatopsis eburnea]|uniref:TetR/AcrR family transcriptional regulator n=1 Tax=Amycolatopsis eburnea TaxID=2267691 RepID=UPI001CDC8222|nr:TetR/AcrR family transcriptional regulator [Amycolatopsis eburnea]